MYISFLAIPSIIFRSKDLTKLTFSVGEKFIFATTSLNEGKGYDNKTGIFTAPMTGTYQFSAHVCAASNSQFGIAFIADTRDIHKDFIGTLTSQAQCDTSHITISLQNGSQVYLQCTYAGKLYSANLLLNTFSGSLLHL